jgi:hypothetical protein
VAIGENATTLTVSFLEDTYAEAEVSTSQGFWTSTSIRGTLADKQSLNMHVERDFFGQNALQCMLLLSMGDGDMEDGEK